MNVSLASPRAARMRSRSRAVSTVPTYGSTLPLSCSHCDAYARSFDKRACWAAAVVGAGSGSALVVSEGTPFEPQVTGSLRWTPRGSNETMSKSSRSPGVSTLSSFGRSLMPDPPGPPGLITSEPISLRGQLSGMALNGDLDRGALGVGVVQGNGHRTTLEVRAAGAPQDRRHGQGRLGRGRRGDRRR